jgi:hypothetical protein
MTNGSEALCRACLHNSNSKDERINFITAKLGFETLKLIYTDLTSLQVCYNNSLLNEHAINY